MGYAGFTMPDSHWHAYEDCDRTCVTCFSDLWPKGFLPTKEYSVWFEDYLTMVKTVSPDIVSVCTPDETHCQIVCDIAPYVKAIFLEKPIALTLEDADKMIESCHKHHVILQVNHKRRWTRPVMRFSRGIMRNGTHAIDLLRQTFGGASWIDAKEGVFGETLVDIEYVDTEEPIFELDCVHNDDKGMTLRGVEHLVNCLDNGTQSISSGEEAKETLRVLLSFKREYDKRTGV